MSSLNLQDVVGLSQKYPQLSFGQVQQFISLSSKLKDDILLTQPSSILAFDPPEILPPTIATFLQESCNISAACVDTCWNTLKSTIWNDANSLEDSTVHDFAAHGHSLGLCALCDLGWSYKLISLVDARTLYPPQHTCINPSCECSRSGQLLKKEEQRQAVLYTLDKGAVPVRSVHLYCDSKFSPCTLQVILASFYQSARQIITTTFESGMVSVHIMMEFQRLSKLVNTSLLKNGLYSSGLH